MATVGKISVDFIAKTAAFITGTKKAGKGLLRFRKNVIKAAKRMAKFGAAILAAGAALTAVFVRKSLQFIDRVAKLSDQLGIATKTLSGLGFAAQIAGTDIELLAKSISIMQKNIGDVLIGQGETAVKILEQLGLNARMLADSGADQAFLKIGDAINKLGTSTERMAAARGIFGRGGAAFLSLFKDGSAGIKKLIKDADKLGFSFNRVDAAKVEAANDAVTSMKAVFQGIFQTLAIKLAPLIESTANAFIKWAKGGKGLKENLIGLFDGVADSIAQLIDQLADLADKLQRFIKPAGFRQAIEIRVNQLRLLAAQAGLGRQDPSVHARRLLELSGGDEFKERKSAVEALKEFRAALARNIETTNAGAVATKKATLAIVKFAASIRESIKTRAQRILDFRNRLADAVNAGQLTMKEAVQAYRTKIKEIGTVMGTFAESVRESIRGPVEKFRMFRDNLTKAVEEGSLSVAAAAIALRNRVKEEADALSAPIREFAKSVRESLLTPIGKINKFIDQLREATEGGFLDPASAATALKNRIKEALGALGAPAAAANLRGGTFQEITSSRLSAKGLGFSDPGVKAAVETEVNTKRIKEILQQMLDSGGGLPA